MDISIIIVNYNSHKYVETCLNTIFQYTQNIDFETIVIDNNSPDRGIENLPQHFYKTKFFFKNSNDGFGSGCNFGIKRSACKYYAIINPDTIFNNNVLLKLFNTMEKYPEIGLCSPVFTDEKGNLVFTYNNFPNFHWEFLEFLGFDGTLKETKKLLAELCGIKDKSKPFYVESVTGACMFIRAEVLKKTGGFDENMFLYYEDIDLQKRITDAGYRIACIPELKVVHLENKSTKQGDDESGFYLHLFRSKLIYMKKHMGYFKRNLFRLMHIAGFSIRIIALFFRAKQRKKRKEKLLLYKKILRIYLFNYSI